MIPSTFDELPPRLYHCPASRWSALAGAAQAKGLAVLDTALSGDSGLGDALQKVAADLRFPAWFGNNLDALHDTLTDAAWHRGRSQMIHVGHSGAPLPADDLQGLIDVLASAVDQRCQDRAPLWVAIAFPFAGATELPAA